MTTWPQRWSARLTWSAGWVGWIGALALLGFWLAGLDAAPLFDVDEGAFAEASREMWVSGDWGHTTLNGADRFDKPILVYWLQAASLGLLGDRAGAARLPSALCAWGWCLALWAFAAPRWGRPVAAVAALVLATSAGPMLIGRAATADALLNLLITLCLFDLWRHLEACAQVPRPATLPASPAGPALWRAAVWAGLGLLAKGPVALLVPGLTLLAWGVSQSAWWPGSAGAKGRSGSAAWGSTGQWLVAAAWLLAVAGPWYAYALHRHGQAFVDGFFLRHNLQRFGGPLEGHGGSLLYYLVALPLLAWPWTPALLLVASGARRAWQDPLARYLLLWLGGVLLFFSLSGTKLPHYALYGYTPVALLCGRALVQATGRASRATLLAVALLAALLLLAGVASPGLLSRLAEGRAGQPGWSALHLGDLGDPGELGKLLAPVGAALVLLLVLVVAARVAARRPAPLPATAVAVAVVMLWCCTVVLPWWGQTLQGPLRTLALQARSHDWSLVQWRCHQPSIAFYLGRPVPRRAPGPGEVALVPAHLAAQAAADWRVPTEVLARAAGWQLLRPLAAAPLAAAPKAAAVPLLPPS